MCGIPNYRTLVLLAGRNPYGKAADAFYEREVRIAKNIVAKLERKK